MIPLLFLLLASQAADTSSSQADVPETPPPTATSTAATSTAASTSASDGTPAASTHHREPGSKPGTPALQDPFPFDHQDHAHAFRQVKVTCADCHPVGLTTRDEGSFAWPGDEVPHPYTNCHACHRHEVEGAPRSARGMCLQCHANPEEILPETHDLGWMQIHGMVARTPGNDCEDCHTSSRCIACHDDRGALSQNPHGPGFAAWHGIEARMDPRKCSTCHESSTCTTCHETGSAPW